MPLTCFFICFCPDQSRSPPSLGSCFSPSRPVPSCPLKRGYFLGPGQSHLLTPPPSPMPYCLRRHLPSLSPLYVCGAFFFLLCPVLTSATTACTAGTPTPKETRHKLMATRTSQCHCHVPMERATCSHLEWQLNVDPSMLRDFRHRVQQDFAVLNSPQATAANCLPTR